MANKKTAVKKTAKNSRKKVAKKTTKKKTTAKKTTKRKTKNKGGRPLFDGKDEQMVLLKLENAFSIGCTDLEACASADISPSSLYEYQKKHPKFQERKQVLKEKVVLLARNVVVKTMRESTGTNETPTPRASNMAFDVLIRKRKDEFAEKSIVDNNNFEGVTQERAEEIAEGFENWTIDNDPMKDE